jgi:KUP system potassium uptake protein
MVLDVYSVLKKMSLSEEKAFSLDTSSVTVETVPLIISPPKDLQMNRVE